MLLSSYLDAKLISFEPSPKTREEVYHNMVEKICKAYHLPVCGAKLTELIMQRDRESSTAYNTGIAIPHVRMEGYNDTLISMCFLDNPIDYEGTPVSWIVLIITNKSSSTLYLNLVATLLMLSKSPDQMRELRERHEGNHVVSIMKKMAIKVKETITIGDIMNPSPVTIGPDVLIRDLGNLIHTKNIAVLPVVDANSRYLGEVDILRLLKLGVPDYMFMMDHLGFLGSFEPLEHLFEREDSTIVSDIMNKHEEVISPSASIIDAVFEMIQHNKRFFSVVDNGKLVGIITAMDIFKKVFKS